MQVHNPVLVLSGENPHVQLLYVTHQSAVTRIEHSPSWGHIPKSQLLDRSWIHPIPSNLSQSFDKPSIWFELPCRLQLCNALLILRELAPQIHQLCTHMMRTSTGADVYQGTGQPHT